jgi:hypothetical protein
VREAAGKGRHWTAETAGRASDTLRRSVETASEVGGRVRQRSIWRRRILRLRVCRRRPMLPGRKRAWVAPTAIPRSR